MNILDLLKSLLSLSLGDYIRRNFGTGPGTELLIDVGGVVILSTFCLLIVIFLIWLTRKIVARMQDRVGPNRVGGRYGLLQTVADVIKLLIKEVIHPSGADWVAYNAAPLLTVITALLVWAVMPFAPGVIGVDLNIGVFYIIAISSASVIVLLFGRVGVQQQICLAGRIPGCGPDGQLRSTNDLGPARAHHFGPHHVNGRHHPGPIDPLSSVRPPVGHHLLHHDPGRDGPHAI